MHVPIFETPVFRFDVPDKRKLVPALRRAFLSEYAHVPAFPSQHVRGWQSAPDLQTRPGEPFESLTALLAHHFRLATTAQWACSHTTRLPPVAFAVTAWGVVLSQHQSVRVHAHPGATWAAMLGLGQGDGAWPDPQPTTDFMLYDPRRAPLAVPQLIQSPTGTAMTLSPGELVLFPASVRQAWLPSPSRRPRFGIFARATLRCVDATGTP